MIYLFIKHIRKKYPLITEDWVGLGYKDEERPKKDSEQLRKKKKVAIAPTIHTDAYTRIEY